MYIGTRVACHITRLPSKDKSETRNDRKATFGFLTKAFCYCLTTGYIGSSSVRTVLLLNNRTTEGTGVKDVILTG